jgi:TonB family protein
MYIDFEDYRPETPRVERAISVREAVLISLVLHMAIVLGIVLAPPLPRNERAAEIARQLALRQQQQARADSPRFVFVQPRADIVTPQPRPNVDSSDQDRVASSREQPPDPRNSLPFARGNSADRVEAPPPAPEPREEVSREALAQGSRGAAPPAEREPVSDAARSTLRLPDVNAATPALRVGSGTSGALGDALRNLQRYVQQQSFDNPQGGTDAKGWIQFDTKGVEFGPWIRRFVAQIKRNWFVPYAVWAMKGHVVITFNVHKNGALTDIEVKDPSAVDGFNRAAVNALITSNPTEPLPPEYPSDQAFFTVTFFYNESPPE